MVYSFLLDLQMCAGLCGALVEETTGLTVGSQQLGLAEVINVVLLGTIG